MVTLRPYRADDAPALLALFRDTIRRVNCRDYSPAQIAAWASIDIDLAAWAERFVGRFVAVAEEAGKPVGFAELEPDGHIGRVYVSADHQRQGIGRRLLATIVAEARRLGLARLFTEASITARPFFEAQGFTVLASQVVTCRGPSSSTTEWSGCSRNQVALIVLVLYQPNIKPESAIAGRHVDRAVVSQATCYLE